MHLITLSGLMLHSHCTAHQKAGPEATPEYEHHPSPADVQCRLCSSLGVELQPAPRFRTYQTDSPGRSAYQTESGAHPGCHPPRHHTRNRTHDRQGARIPLEQNHVPDATSHAGCPGRLVFQEGPASTFRATAARQKRSGRIPWYQQQLHATCE